jgi:dihydropteroate synthase
VTATYLHPVPRSGDRPEGALPLAGSRSVWFAEVLARQAGGALAPADPAPVLSASRPDLLGLTLDRPRIMGILNVTPDSFSDGGDLASIAAVVARAQAMAASADILDIGGESTRPGAAPVPLAEERARVLPAIRAIRDAGITTPISIDTRNAALAEAALDAGAAMVNDVTALTHDPAMAALVAERGVPVCLMHSRGDPATMQHDPRYGDVVTEVYDHLEARVAAALSAGIRPENLIVDPGIGFGKTLQHNVSLIRGLALYHGLGLPLLLGASRKRFIGTLSGAETAKDRLAGSLAIAVHAAGQGAHVLRVHDATETKQALTLWQALTGADGNDA